jgi:hypothetical protein
MSGMQEGRRQEIQETETSAELEFHETERRRRLVAMTTELILDCVARANERSVLRRMEPKNRVHKK